MLNEATVDGASLHAERRQRLDCTQRRRPTLRRPRRPPANDIAKACWAGGTIQIYINADPAQDARAADVRRSRRYDEVRAAVRAAFQGRHRPGQPGRSRSILRIMNKEELRNVDGSDSLHPNRSGDVVVVTRPPYQSDAGTAGQAIALSHFFGQHGYLPNYVDLANNINMHATFVMAGPGIKHKDNVKDLRAVDIAPTLAFLMGIPGPQNARGAILYDLVKGAETLREVTILDISDYHGQLIPLAEAPDNLPAPRNRPSPSAAPRSSRPWFDIYAAEAVRSGEQRRRRSSRWRPATRSVRRRRSRLLRRQADDRDHEHDGHRHRRPRQPQLRPRRRLSCAQTLDPAGELPVRLGEHRRRERQDAGGVVAVARVQVRPTASKIGIVGFSNDDIPSLTKPGALDPFHVANSLAAVNAEAARIAKKVDAIVAIGHLGATAGTLTAPTGPLLDLANDVSNVDVVDRRPHRPAGADDDAERRPRRPRTAARASASRASGS